MLAFYPEFETADTDMSFEVVIVVDLSNSMKGNAVEDAIKVALLALHHLPATCLFNIITFGTGTTSTLLT